MSLKLGIRIIVVNQILVLIANCGKLSTKLLKLIKIINCVSKISATCKLWILLVNCLFLVLDIISYKYTTLTYKRATYTLGSKNMRH